EPSPRGMMDAKNFEKIYTLTGLQDGVAVIEMNAVPAARTAEQGEVGRQAMMMAMFAGMMESRDNYTGKLLLNADGTVKQYKETLDAKWFATDLAAQPDAEPDRITIGYLQKHRIERIK
ncbi:MAG TPA: hypothetical protein VLH60_00800, partial [Sedimentisphaerales bacterium]|nr:hypothetical protein [Sedimentisphaerales bacterium]